MLIVKDAQRAHHLIVVVQGLAHAHEDDVEWFVHAERGGIPAPVRRFPGRQVADEPHLAGQAERAGHGTQPTWVEMQKVIAGVSDEHRFDLPAIRQA